MSITDLISPNSELRKKRYLRRLEGESKDIYQLREFKGQLWLTYNGFLVCPTSLFSEEAIKTLEEIRKLYVERNTTEND